MSKDDNPNNEENWEVTECTKINDKQPRYTWKWAGKGINPAGPTNVNTVGDTRPWYMTFRKSLHYLTNESE